MKRKLFVLSLLLFFLTINVDVFAQSLRNANGNETGKIESDGTIRNVNGNKIGKIESDGTVRNANGNKIGKIESDGTIRNVNGNKTGSAQGIDKKRAAIVFFFYD